MRADTRQLCELEVDEETRIPLSVEYTTGVASDITKCLLSRRPLRLIILDEFFAGSRMMLPLSIVAIRHDATGRFHA